MIYIKQYYSYYFESYSKNDQGLFANLAFLKSRLFTGAADLFTGITHLIGRIKPGFGSSKVNTAAQTVFPVGFRNYGNSCWLASGMQLLLACEQFEAIVRAPLKQTIIHYQVRDLNYNWSFAERPETPEEFEKRETLQQSLLVIIDASKTSNQEAMTAALKQFHQCVLDLRYPGSENFHKLGCQGHAYDLFRLVSRLFPGDVEFLRQQWMIHYLNPDHFSQFHLEQLAKMPYKEQRPKICIIPANWAVDNFRLDEQIDLSNHYKDGIYKLVGITHTPWKGHSIARTRRQNQTYQYDDSRVTKDSMIVNPKKLHQDDTDFLVLEQSD